MQQDHHHHRAVGDFVTRLPATEHPIGCIERWQNRSASDPHYLASFDELRRQQRAAAWVGKRKSTRR